MDEKPKTVLTRTASALCENCGKRVSIAYFPMSKTLAYACGCWSIERRGVSEKRFHDHLSPESWRTKRIMRVRYVDERGEKHGSFPKPERAPDSTDTFASDFGRSRKPFPQ